MNQKSNLYSVGRMRKRVRLFLMAVFASGSTHGASSQDLSWIQGPPLPFPVREIPGSTFLAYKNPTVVRDADGWCIIASEKRHAAGATRHGLVAMRFPTWQTTSNAKITPILEGEPYVSAPYLFRWSHTGTWYLFYDWQNGAGQKGPAWSTLPDLDHADKATPPTFCYENTPTNLPKANGVRWLDPTVIADDRHVYLFMADDSGHLIRCRTERGAFPRGWEPPVVALDRPTAELFESCQVFRDVRNRGYLFVAEALDAAPGRPTLRFYTSWFAPTLDGAWIPRRQTVSQPFAGVSNVRGDRGSEPWSPHVSHGELVRSTYDEMADLPPEPLQFLAMGWDGTDRIPGIPRGPRQGYHEIPWRLMLLRQN